MEAVRKEGSTIKEDLPNIVKDLVKGEVGGHGSKRGPSAPGAPSRARTGADDKKAERSSRTVTFGTFPEDTKADDIVEFMNGILKDVNEQGYLEDAFAFGEKVRGERGGQIQIGRRHVGEHEESCQEPRAPV